MAGVVCVVCFSYARFVHEEVLPAVLRDPHVAAAYPNLQFSSDPDLRAAYGCSSGGAASLTMAWFRPDLFRRVVACVTPDGRLGVLPPLTRTTSSHPLFLLPCRASAGARTRGLRQASA